MGGHIIYKIYEFEQERTNIASWQLETLMTLAPDACFIVPNPIMEDDPIKSNVLINGTNVLCGATKI
jgi:hypothetical protein